MSLIRALLLFGCVHSAIVVDALALKKPAPTASEIARVKAKNSNSFDDVFKGGAFEKEDPIPGAIKIASKLRTVKDLGWTGKAKERNGNTRPRHRAWGGEGELPIQEKANFDESNPATPDKWLTPEEFYSRVRTTGPSADAVYVALAGGKKYAERSNVEALLLKWRNGKSFDEDEFIKSVKQGQNELISGWAAFIGFQTIAISCIVFPTNPLAVTLQGGLEKLLS